MRASVWMLTAAALMTAGSPGGARAQPLVHLELEGIFGSDLLTGGTYQSVVIEARNQTGAALRGTIEIAITSWNEIPERHQVALDLPAGEQRWVSATIMVPATSGDVLARYLVEGQELANASQTLRYAAGGRSVVVGASPARLRASLLDMAVTIQERPYPGAPPLERAVQLPVGVVREEPRTGDPMLPDEVLGWSSVAVAVFSAPMLERASDAQRRAIVDWIHTGGHLVIAPRTQGDLSSPIAREWLGQVTSAPPLARPPTVNQPLSIGQVPQLTCPGPSGGGAHSEGSAPGPMDVHAEPYGCVARIGAGAIHLLSFDATAPPHVDERWTADLIRAIAQRAIRPPVERVVPFGAVADELSEDVYQPRAGAAVRSALDPNDAYRPALGLVGLLLVAYVLVVGPLNFTLVQRRNRPTLALVTTPAIGLAFAALLLVLGYIGKGVTTRSRRIVLIDAVAGAARAPEIEYAGYFLTRPATASIAPPEGAGIWRWRRSSDDRSFVEHRGSRSALERISAGLWETLFVRIDRIVDLGRGVEVETLEDGTMMVSNGTQRPLRRLVALRPENNTIHLIDELAPGARERARPATARLCVNTYDETADITALAEALRIEDQAAVRALFRMLRPCGRSELQVIAQLPPDEGASTTPSFASETDLRFILVRPLPSFEPLRNPPPLPAPEDY